MRRTATLLLAGMSLLAGCDTLDPPEDAVLVIVVDEGIAAGQQMLTRPGVGCSRGTRRLKRHLS